MFDEVNNSSIPPQSRSRSAIESPSTDLILDLLLEIGCLYCGVADALRF
jgi:hypothetical protein